jgi:hypothetical protein
MRQLLLGDCSGVHNITALGAMRNLEELELR